MASGCFNLCRHHLNLLFFADALHRTKMLLCGLILTTRLNVGDLSFIHEFSRECALVEELLPALVQLLCRIQ
jgi:hypothetical protein